MSLPRLAGLFALTLLLTGCQSMPAKTIPTEPSVDLQRFMGDWYVIAAIPTAVEKEAYNAVESYALTDAGRVQTTFRFRKGGFDGPVKVYEPNATVKDASNAVWGMQFVWPFRADYRIVFVDDDYQRTVIGRNKRDYVWFMARSPEISEADMAEMQRIAREVGYELTDLRIVPQRWPEAG